MKQLFSSRPGSVQPRLLIAASLVVMVGLIYVINLQQGVSYASTLEESDPGFGLASSAATPSSGAAPTPSTSSTPVVATSPSSSASQPTSAATSSSAATTKPGSQAPSGSTGGSNGAPSQPQKSSSPKASTKPNTSASATPTTSTPGSTPTDSDPTVSDPTAPVESADPILAAQQVVEGFQNTITTKNQQAVLSALAPYLQSGAISEQYLANQLAAAERVPHWPSYRESGNIAVYLVRLVSVAVQKSVNVF